MASPESGQYHPDIQEKFYTASLDIPTLESIILTDVYTAEGKLDPSYQALIKDTIIALQVIPKGQAAVVNAIFHPHENSSGQYHFEGTFGSYETYAYYLPPGESTSRHAHDATEYYFLLAGTYTLRLNEEEASLSVLNSRFVIVGPGVEHQGLAGDGGALVVTVTHNPDTIPKDQLHIYHDSWKKDWEMEKEQLLFQYDSMKI